MCSAAAQRPGPEGGAGRPCPAGFPHPTARAQGRRRRRPRRVALPASKAEVPERAGFLSRNLASPLHLGRSVFPLTGRNLGGHLQSEDAGGCHARWGRPRRRTRDRVGVSSHACITSRGTMSDQRLLREKARTRAVGSWRPAAFPVFVCGSAWSQRPPRGLRGCRLLQKQSDWGRVQRERATVAVSRNV